MPSKFVGTVVSIPVSTFFAVTVASTMAAAFGSSTRPVTLAKALCAGVEAQSPNAQTNVQTKRHAAVFFFMYGTTSPSRLRSRCSFPFRQAELTIYQSSRICLFKSFLRTHRRKNLIAEVFVANELELCLLFGDEDESRFGRQVYLRGDSQFL